MSKFKNVVIILLDALAYKNIDDRLNRESPSKFLDELRKHSIFCPNVFSEAPFTEGAMIATHAGENTFDRGGYLYGNKNCKLVLAEYFRDNGYYTIGTYSPYIFPSAMSRGFDEPYYMNTVKISIMKQFRLKEFKRRYDKEVLNDEDYDMAGDLIEDELRVLIDFLDCIIRNDDRIKLIKDALDKIDYQKMKNDIEGELNDYLNNPKAYVELVFRQWDKSKLFNHPQIEIVNKVNDTVKKTVLARHKKDFELIKNFQLKQAKHYGKMNYKSLFSETMSQGVLAGYRYFEGVRHFRTNTDFDEDFERYDSKYCMSMNKVLFMFEKRLIELNERQQPYFAYIHLDDFHFPSTFFSYDCTNIEQIDEEFENIKRYVENLNGDYCGNLRSDLSVLYIDTQLRMFFDQIDGKFKDTVFVITADHGNCYYNNPIRATGHMDFQCEKFQTPLFVFGNDVEPQEVSGIFSTKDLFRTVVEYAGVNDGIIDNECFEDTRVIGRDSSREYVITEWGGPGIPDLRFKPIYQSIFDGRYHVGVKSMVSQSIIPRDIVSVYDLQKDPDEEVNIAYKIRNSDELYQYINILQQRKAYIIAHGCI